MAVPKRKHSNHRTGIRRSHDAKKAKEISYCSQCRSPVISHVVCPTCGFYGGRKVVEMEEKKSKK